MRTHNLPLQPTSFVGRIGEISEITSLLDDANCRLLTLAGPGGIGKTRLAIEVAAGQLENFVEGVYFITLQSIDTVEILVSAMADAIGFSLSGQEEPGSQLLSYLNNKNMLLILDNFEQLLEAGNLLAEIVQNAPQVKLLVTSREVLNLREEWLFYVEGLELPADDQNATTETCSAVRLFNDRARRVRADFSLRDEWECVVHICKLVTGMPLGIELAAAWLRTLPCAEIASEIQRNVDFLTTSLRNVPERHRSMRAVFEQSWSLLSEEEQIVFKRLSVFQGGFRRDAAKQVAGASLPVLSALVEKSLLQFDLQGYYHMHGLLRQCAQEYLVQSADEVQRVYDAFCTYYADFLFNRKNNIMRSGQREAITEIEAEIDNIRLAWSEMVARNRIEDIQKSTYVLSEFFQYRSRYPQGAAALEKAATGLETADMDELSSIALAEVLVNLSWYYVRLGRLDEAEAVALRSRTLWNQLDSVPPLGQGSEPLTVLGMLALIRGHYDQATALLEEACELSEMRDDHLNVSFSHYLLTSVALAAGQYERARHHADLAVRGTQNQWYIAYYLNEQGNVARALGDYATASRYYQESYDIRQAFYDPEGMAVALNHLGKVALLQADYRRAGELYEESRVLYQDTGDRGGLATALEGLGYASCAQGHYQDSKDYFLDALHTTLAAHLVPQTLSVLCGIGELAFHLGQHERSVELSALVAHHPASDQETRDRATHRLEQYQKHLAGETFDMVVEYGKMSVLEVAAASVQDELNTLQMPPTGHVAVSFDSDSQTANQLLIDPLSPRELEILRLLAEGLTNQDIAERLFVVVGTVKAHNHHIYSKLGVTNRVQAIARARELNLLQN